MSEENRYEVIFNGLLAPEIEEQKAMNRLALLLKCEASEVEKLFNGNAYRLSQNLTLEQAKRYQTQLKEKVGIITEIYLNGELITIEEKQKEVENEEATITKDKTSSSEDREEENLPPPSSSIVKPSTAPSTDPKRGKAILGTLSAITIAAIAYSLYSGIQHNQLKKEHQTLLNKYEHLEHTYQGISHNAIEARRQLEAYSSYALAQEKHAELVPSCESDFNNNKILGRLLKEEFPKFLAENNPEYQFTYNKVHGETENAFDLEKNRRICSVAVEYETLEQQSKQKANLVFELMYQTYFDDEDELAIHVMKQTQLGQVVN